MYIKYLKNYLLDLSNII